MDFVLSRSDKYTKKYVVKFINPKTGRQKSLNFGAFGMEDYTTSKDDKRRERYLQRHHAREDWKDLSSAGAWSRWLLWEKKTLPSAIRNMEKKFGIKIRNNVTV
jgi:hypothetical protein